METFLHSTKAHLAQLHKRERVHVVLGNEACDMDSVASSLLYAYFIYKANVRPGAVVVPVLNIHQREFHLRADVNRFLEEVNISPELLIFRNNVDLKTLSCGYRLSLTLVDHNILNSDDRELQPLVDEVIDHHTKELDYDQSKCQVTIERVGSTCTLIGEKLLKELPGIFDNNIALLLYGTILLDTHCLSPEAKRVTPKDKEIAEKLEIILGGVDRVDLFSRLHKWRNDVSGMSLSDLLRRDLKVISNDTLRIAVSSVPTSLEELSKNEAAEQDLKSFVAETGSQILVIMGIRSDSTSPPVRQIAIYSEQSYREQIAELLENASTKGPTLHLIPLACTLPSMALYNQTNIAGNRKVVLPLLNSFLGTRSITLNIGGCSGSSSNSCDDSNNPANNRRPTPEGRNEEDDVVNFDPLAAESEDVVVESVSTALGHLHVLGVGDPISHAGSSQSSSNQNSCPYTPQNSCTDGGLEQDPYARQILPSFNSREMMEKIESKRGKLRGYVGDGEGDYNATTSYPFTPKNSFVDGSFESFIRGASTTNFDTGEFMLQVNDRVARFTAKRTEPDGAGCSASEIRKPTQNGSLGGDLHGHKESESKSPERNPEGKDDDNCPEGTSLSDKFDKMDTSETSVSSEKTSPLMDGPSPQAMVKQQSDINTSLTEDNLTSNMKTTQDFQKQTTDTNNFNHMTTKPGSSRTDSSTSMSSFHDETELPTNYMTETVDFPSSPHQMKLMQRSTNGLQDPSGEETVHEDDESSWMDQEDDLFRNVLSPESDEAKLKKAIKNIMESTWNIETTRGNNGNDTCSLETSDCTSNITGDESMQLEDLRLKLPYYPSSISDTSKEHVSPDTSSVAYANFGFNPKNSTSTPFKYEEFKPELVPLPSVREQRLNFTENRHDISQLIIEKIDHCYNSNLRIKDMALLCENLKSELTSGEIKQVLERTSFFSEYFDDYVFEALQMIALESPQPVTATAVKKTKIKLDLESLDDSIVNHFEGELRMEAIFERNSSFRIPKSTSKSISSSIYKNKTEGHSTIRSTILQPEVSEPSSAVRKTLIAAPLALSVINSSEDSTSSPQTETSDSQPKAKLEFPYKDMMSTAIPTCDFNPNPTRKEWQSLTYFSDSTSESSPDRPNSLNTTGKKKRKIKVNPDILNTTDDADDKSLSSLSNRSDGDILSPSLDDLITPDDITTPDILDDSLYSPPELIPEVSAAEERDDERRWRTCVVSGVQQKIDMKVIEPYKKILSHGGYYGPKRSAIVVFCACFLPDHGRKDYDYVIDNLFLYILTTLDQLVAEDYLLVYLHGALERNNMPSFGWLKRCYNLIDRRLRKNLKGLYLVHPTFWLKTIVLMTKPFVSSKFARKLQFVSSLQDLFDLIPVDHMSIPDKVKQLDFELMIKEKKKHNKKQVHSCEPKQGGTKNDWTERSLKEVDTDAPYRKAHSESQEFTEGWL